MVVDNHRKIEISLYEVASNLLGMKEVVGKEHEPFIQWCFSTTTFPAPYTDEDAWCSALLNGLCKLLGVERTNSAAAISWEEKGIPITLAQAEKGMDILVWEHHVGLYGGRKGDKVICLGGNQGNRVSEALLLSNTLKAVRRLRKINHLEGRD